MDKIYLTSDHLKCINDKFDIILQELKKISTKFEQKSKQLEKKDNEHDLKFEQINKKLNEHDLKFEQINKKLDEHDLKFEQINKKLDEHDYKLDLLDRRLTKLESENREEHSKIINLLTSLNSAFLRYETEGIDKIDILFDANKNHMDHQTIYGHEFKRLNDLVAKNSFRISNLEKHQ